MARDCPLLPRVPQQQTQSQPLVQQQQQQVPVQQRQQAGGSGGSRARGRVTHLTRANAKAAQLVEGTVTVFGFTTRVLFDTGASHSFVSEEFLDSLGELSSGESIDLAVELPTGDFVLTSYCLEEASTPWTPTLIPASSDVDANFSDLHALQSPEFWKQATPTIGELSPMTHYLLRRTGVVGDETLVEETLESDSERRD
ncbi:hypothetical protein Taro_036834 [Colocasia esculenta]|uniref:Gag-pol polyprotein n=1 Tax=Colocasia esculenta TaxID=4460 RepID=A0A843W439_COLES|nr:hypothetical protein [Colocasia esculenta]